MFHRKGKPFSSTRNESAIGDRKVLPRLRKRSRTRLVVRTVIVTLFAFLCLTVIAGAIIVRAGWYDVSAIVQHWQPVYSLTEYTVKKSVERRAKGSVAPVPSPDSVLRGEQIYQTHCLECHGGPGISPGDIGKSMQPAPGPLVIAARRWRREEMYWIIQNGIKMTGMPAWEYRLSEADIWATVAYLDSLPYKQAKLQSGDLPERASQGYPGNALRGRIALTQYACASCHRIPGIPGSDVHVGPGLDQYAERRYIAGYLPNSAENLAFWIRFPQHVKPLSAMPEMGVSDADARDMAAYLYHPR